MSTRFFVQNLCFFDTSHVLWIMKGVEHYSVTPQTKQEGKDTELCV